MPAPLIPAALLGLLSSAHCIGMCGGFAVAVGAGSPNFHDALRRQTYYSFGRIATYAFLGTLAGFAGASIVNSGTMLAAQQFLSIFAGVALICVGLGASGLIRLPRRYSGAAARLFAPAFSCALQSPHRHGLFLAGLANGFLPCGLVYAALAIALAAGSMSLGAATMAVFGLGTVPAMLAAGLSSRLIALRWRQRLFRVAACGVAVMGFVTIVRGVPSEDGAACCAGHADTTSAAAPNH